ncbi:MAG TPA: TIGR02452 family protein [Herpetosiphonaceae bacterium]
MNRTQRARLAQETLAILESGTYALPDARTISIRDALSASCANTTLYRPADSESILAQVAAREGIAATSIRVSNRTTLEAAQDLSRSYSNLICLNFASAKNPGGGFLSGSQAQEESLARSSGLYATLQTQPEFYSYHRQHTSSLYSDHMIFSPQVPVFRDDSGSLLESPWLTSFITAAAVNAGAVHQNQPAQIAHIEPAMQRRARLVLGVAALHGCDALILGAWGCGVFRNDPAMVAAIFARVLDEPLFKHRFAHVEFAVYDPAPQQATLAAFERAF